MIRGCLSLVRLGRATSFVAQFSAGSNGSSHNEHGAAVRRNRRSGRTERWRAEQCSSPVAECVGCAVDDRSNERIETQRTLRTWCGEPQPKPTKDRKMWDKKMFPA